jgi:hypothetical protein
LTGAGLWTGVTLGGLDPWLGGVTVVWVCVLRVVLLPTVLVRVVVVRVVVVPLAEVTWCILHTVCVEEGWPMLATLGALT